MRSWLKIETITVILGIPIVLFTFWHDNVDDKWWNNPFLKYTFFGIYVVIILIIFFPVLKSLFKKLKFWTGLEVIINYQNGHLEFLDKNGDEAHYSEENQFKKIKKKVRTSGTLSVDGKIKNKMYTYNCHSYISDNEDLVEIVYGIFDNGNENKSIMDDQKYFGYAISLSNSFPSENEYWSIRSVHYTKIYDIKLSFPNSNPPKDVYIKEIFRDENNIKTGEKRILCNPIIIKKYNRTIIKAKLLDLKKGKEFEIWWKWNKKSSLDKKTIDTKSTERVKKKDKKLKKTKLKK